MDTEKIEIVPATAVDIKSIIDLRDITAIHSSISKQSYCLQIDGKIRPETRESMRKTLAHEINNPTLGVATIVARTAKAQVVGYATWIQPRCQYNSPRNESTAVSNHQNTDGINTEFLKQLSRGNDEKIQTFDDGHKFRQLKGLLVHPGYTNHNLNSRLLTEAFEMSSYAGDTFWIQTHKEKQQYEEHGCELVGKGEIELSFPEPAIELLYFIKRPFTCCDKRRSSYNPIIAGVRQYNKNIERRQDTNGSLVKSKEAMQK